MRFLAFTYLVFNILFVLSSCSSKQSQMLFEQRNTIDTAAQKNIAVTSGYQIKSQDILQIRNLQNTNYIVAGAPTENATSGGSTASGGGETFQVEETGDVALPVIGYVHVAGLTLLEAAKKIEDMYRASLLKNPIIELKIINLKVTMLGEVKSQGNFPLVKDRTGLIEMIGEAGGLTDKANEKNIEIIRGSQSNPTVVKVDLSNISSLADPATILQNGDIIYVAQNKRAARADNLQNFSVLLQPALILFNTALIIFTLAHR